MGGEGITCWRVGRKRRECCVGMEEETDTSVERKEEGRMDGGRLGSVRERAKRHSNGQKT